MELEQIEKILTEKFNQPLTEEKDRQIIFWYDAEGDFKEDIDRLQVANAKIWKLTGDNKFATKYQLEVKDQESNYLVYASYPQPDYREDWLLDISSYADDFTADKVTVIMKDFGVEDPSLRPVFKKYKKFFNNKRRYNRLLDYDIEDYTERKLDTAIISAVCKLKATDLEEAVKKVLMNSLTNDQNKWLTKIKKFANEDKFWELIENKYGYLAEDKDLADLMALLTVTNLEHDLNVTLPEEWSDYLSYKDNNCIVFIDHWMNHSSQAEVYDNLSTEIETKLNLQEYITNWELEDFLECDTFKSFDTAIIDRIVDNLLNDIDDFKRYQDIISLRRTKHWYPEFEEVYEAIYWAVELFKQAKEQSIRQIKATDFFNKYTEKYYLFDQAYRKFYSTYDQAKNKSLLRELRDKVENLYTNSYLHELSINWSNSVDQELKESWPLGGITQQQEFYQEFIADKSERTFVIISDALRYEVAQEFSQKLNNRLKGTTELYAMQGSLPSYTKLGMASLLPHQELNINQQGQISVDGISSQGLKNREKILAEKEPDSTVITYEELVELSRSELRERMKGTQVVYIYHNEIDAKGDHATTEKEVFSAVENTFTQLDTILRILKHSLSATHVYITADHGFIYRRRALESSDKTERLKSDLIERKRRFIISDQQVEPDGTLSVNLDYIFGEDSNLQALVPRGVNRFTLQGPGQNYVHGGAALQEIVIPVVQFRNDRSKESDNEVNKVEVKLTSITRELTNNISYLDFFQTEKVAEKLIPRRLKLYFTDESGEKISNENIIIADSNSSEPNQRSFKEKFTLKNREYSREEDYYLVMIDQENNQVYKEIKFSINLL
ncbi:TIGR02687 family protein [Halobacteroides halobius DSM 5150]|uniref:TIGR02687 family protein n=1 Tax=Halobacteroides halobius (strain ATCC 35273 / DSM 5150 / MD-1) TaxID=748449 RepID=L0K9L0_HALHC|nr:BREX-1 system phosphatase PglZ type A [Halobacteroides halobius]AGB41054.1 TIGR02687 family protein [Halobacteroides halobius DSM 5150]